MRREELRGLARTYHVIHVPSASELGHLEDFSGSAELEHVRYEVLKEGETRDILSMVSEL